MLAGAFSRALTFALPCSGTCMRARFHEPFRFARARSMPAAAAKLARKIATPLDDGERAARGYDVRATA